MAMPHLTPGQLWWMSRFVIPASVVCGGATLILWSRLAMEPDLPWVERLARLLFELVIVAAIGRLIYRMVRLQRLGDSET